MSIVFRRMTGDDAKVVLDEPYIGIYLDIRKEPPYNSGPLYSRERFVDRTRSQTERPGFELVAAEHHGNVIGFAFGLTMEAGRWWGGDTTPPPADVLAADKVAVIELNLLAEYRGRGIGKRTLSELLAGRREPWATLLSMPDAPAHAMYERWGWRAVGTVQPAPDTSPMDAMAIERAQ